jgi:multiple sugar transport system ATP-binding protein
MTVVKFEGVYKLFGDRAAVSDLWFEIAEGEFVVLVGPSGCGKTTTLRMLAGVERPTYGRILVGDRVMNNVPAKDRNIAMVFQSYALFPHLNVYDNLAFGLKVRGEARKNIQPRIYTVSEVIGISHLLKQRPAQLSGGERQRVALGRAMLREPDVFLLDEPLSNLDAALRTEMRAELTRLHARLGVATLYVTHDQVEAMTMGDRIGVMRDGQLQQAGPPQEIYDAPANKFVATFIGSPRMNIVPGRYLASESRIDCLGTRFDIDPLPTHRDAREVEVGLRPEDIHWVTGEAASDAETLFARVELIEPLGTEAYLTVLVDDVRLRVRVPSRSGIRAGDDVQLKFDTGRMHIFDAESSLNLRVVNHESAGLHVQESRGMHPGRERRAR